MLLLRKTHPAFLSRTRLVPDGVNGELLRERVDADHRMLRVDYRSPTRARAGGRQKIERRLAAILGADIVGYSALMGRAEEETHRRVDAEIDRVFREIEKSHGRVFTFAGDGAMAEFPSAIEALKCAMRIQADAGRRNAALPADQQI